jgi:SnoaL-like domain
MPPTELQHRALELSKESAMAGSELARMLDDWAVVWSSSEVSDPGKLLALFTDDCVFENVTFGVVARGKEALRSLANRAFAAVPDLSTN